MQLPQVLLTDSGLPISSAHASELNTTVLVCLKDRAKVPTFIFAAQTMVNRI